MKIMHNQLIGIWLSKMLANNVRLLNLSKLYTARICVSWLHNQVKYHSESLHLSFMEPDNSKNYYTK